MLLLWVTIFCIGSYLSFSCALGLWCWSYSMHDKATYLFFLLPNQWDPSIFFFIALRILSC